MKCILIKDYAKKYSDNLIELVSSNGVLYTATVDNLPELNMGTIINVYTAIPQQAETSNLALNINDLGEHTISRMSMDGSTTMEFSLAPNRIYTLLFTGEEWITMNYPAITENDFIGTLAISQGGTGYHSIVDTTYTTARYRASALKPKANISTPTQNGVINWSYE